MPRFIMRMVLITLQMVILSIAGVDTGVADQGPSAKTAKQIIESFVQDFRSDRFAADPVLFGIQVVDQGEWHVRVTGEKSEDGWGVVLGTGMPPTPTYYYMIDMATLRAIDAGELNALTAQGKAFSDDASPMEVRMMEGYEPSPEEYASVNPHSFHFWTRGFPEVIPFGEGLTRRLHGSPIVGLYYETGLRTAYSRIEPRETIRDDPREQAMPFLIMIVCIGGTAEGTVDGHRVTLTAGNVVFVPPFAPHKWWNEKEEAAEALLIMFGEGA